MEGDVGASQETVKLMAQETGLAFFKNVIDRQIPEATEKPTKIGLWQCQVQPMLQLLTHTRVVDSNMLEQQVATICNFLQGVGGRRMKALFNFILDLLDVWSTLPMAAEDESGISACELSLSALATMIDCNTSNIVNDNFSQIVERFRGRVQATHHSSNDFSRLQAQKYLQYLRRRLGVGDALGEAEAEKKVPVTRAGFVMQKDLPGRLSAEGPRHDNDRVDIFDIRILPTYQEIGSTRNEYLPTTDSSRFHIPGIRGRLDREFRLLREDTVGQLRDAVRVQLDIMRDPGRSEGRGNRTALRTYTYEQVAVVDIDFSRNRGMDLLVQFRQPASEKSTQHRQDWWTNSKRLQAGSLVCVVSGNGSVLFCVVADSTIVTQKQQEKSTWKESKEEEKVKESARKPSLAYDSLFSYVHLHLAEVGSTDIAQALRWSQDIGPKPRLCLVEFPGILLASFQHTLIALQRMSKKPDVPFTEFLASTEQKLDVVEVGPPHYLTKPGFFFDLTCLTNDGTTLQHSLRTPLDPQELSAHSTLDTTQSSALLNTLLRCLASIQGPPGTGKSKCYDPHPVPCSSPYGKYTSKRLYVFPAFFFKFTEEEILLTRELQGFTGEKIIKALLANQLKANLGPILCVCYTNHALDQLMVYLKRDGINIIRIGSRSKIEELEGVNLRVISQAADRTKAEKKSLWELTTIIDEDVSLIMRSIQELLSC
jgi:hypothetical protein